MKRIAVALTTLALLAVLGTAALLSGCGGVPGDAVATVGDVSITKTEFEKLMAQAKTQITSQGATFPDKGSPSSRRPTAARSRSSPSSSSRG
jgi:hypothetical protein